MLTVTNMAKMLHSVYLPWRESVLAEILQINGKQNCTIANLQFFIASKL